MKYLSSIIILLLSASAAVAGHDYRPSKLLIATLEVDRQLGSSKSSKSKYKVFAKAKEKSKGSKSKSSTTYSQKTSKSAKSSITNLDIDISDSERPTPENSSILSTGSEVDPTKPPPDSLAIEVPSEENSISTTDSSTDRETQPSFFEIEDSGFVDNGSHSQVFTKGSKSKGSKSEESKSKQSKSGSSKDSQSRQTPKSVKAATTRSSKASHSKQTSSKSAKSATTKSNKSKSSSQKKSSSTGRTGANLITSPPSPSPTGVPEENRTKFLESEGGGSGLTTQNMIVGATALFAILATIAAVSIKRKRLASKAVAYEDNILDSVDISPAEAVVTPMPNRPPSSNKDVSPVNENEYGYSCDMFGFNSCML